jgi:hypothetical protein
LPEELITLIASDSLKRPMVEQGQELELELAF